MTDDIKYEYKSVQAVRGMEARSTAKARAEGWVLVDQTQGRLRTTMNFRRPKKPVPWYLIGAAAGLVLIVAIVGGIAVALDGGDEKEPSAAKSNAASSATPPGASTEAPSERPSGKYRYEGPAYDIVAIDEDVTKARLNQYWVHTNKFDYSTDAFRDQVKAIITDIARREKTPKLIVQVVTDREIVAAESNATIGEFMEEHGGDYFKSVIAPKEKTDWVAWYQGGFDADTGEPSDSADVFGIDWIAEAIQGSEKWKPEV